MSDYDKAIFDFWYNRFIEAMRDIDDTVSAGRVGRAAKKSRNTAKKYLEAMVGMGILKRVYSVGKNGFDVVEYGLSGE